MTAHQCPWRLTELARQGGAPIQCGKQHGHDGEHCYPAKPTAPCEYRYDAAANRAWCKQHCCYEDECPT